MAQLATDYMESHGTRIIKKCVPVRIDKAADGLLHVTWKDSVTGESRKEPFETVLFAIGKNSIKTDIQDYFFLVLPLCKYVKLKQR